MDVVAGNLASTACKLELRMQDKGFFVHHRIPGTDDPVEALVRVHAAGRAGLESVDARRM